LEGWREDLVLQSWEVQRETEGSWCKKDVLLWKETENKAKGCRESVTKMALILQGRGSSSLIKANNRSLHSLIYSRSLLSTCSGPGQFAYTSYHSHLTLAPPEGQTVIMVATFIEYFPLSGLYRTFYLFFTYLTVYCTLCLPFY
jgi:hypothetical protein